MRLIGPSLSSHEVVSESSAEERAQTSAPAKNPKKLSFETRSSAKARRVACTRTEGFPTQVQAR
eukprot:8940441-Pyramimonas_sp.AAC.1